MNDFPAGPHQRVVILDGRGDTSLQKAKRGPDDFIPRGLQSGPTAV